MAGKIHRFDIYDLRKYKPYDIDAFVDIGANKGTTSMMARILFPEARIIAIEPCREIFDEMKSNLKLAKGVECFNIAFGVNSKMYFVPSRRHSGLNRFVVKDDVINNESKYAVESKTLSQVFNDLKIDINSRFILKIDCEGAEKYLLDNQDDISIVLKSMQTMIELHGLLPIESGMYKKWTQWFKLFNDSHDINIGNWSNDKYIYSYCYMLPHSDTAQIELVQK